MSTDQLGVRLDALARAADLAEGRVDTPAIAAARQVAGKASERLRIGGRHTVVALLGATGAGKSSVANALVGSDVATTGVRRPTTSSTMAMVWGDDPATELLDWLGVHNRHLVALGEHPASDLDGLVLLDVPDHDSVRVEHRLEMERIADHADLLVWVADPEKYADRAMHDYLARLSSHDAVTIVALNKTDRLSADDVGRTVADLERLLREAGFASAPVVAVSATTSAGIDALVTPLAGAVGEHKAAVARLSADVARSADDLLAGVGGAAGDAAGPHRKIARRLGEAFAEAAGVDAVADAVAAGHQADARAAMGWPVTRWLKRRPHPLRRFRLHAGSTGRTSLPTISTPATSRVNAAIRTAADDASSGLPEPWPRLVRDAAQPDPSELADAIDQAVATGVRSSVADRPRWWGAVSWLQRLLLVAFLLGVVWLGAMFVVAWLQLPDLPVPKWGRVPIPTLLTVGGALAGILIGALARALARLGARRQAAAAKRRVIDETEQVAAHHVVEPIERELHERAELVALLTTART